MKKIVYVDLDNTLVDFESGIKKCSPEVLAQYALMDEMDGAKESFQFLTEHFDTYILSTAPWNNPTAWSDKLLWVKSHLGAPAYKRLILSHHKDLLRGDYLIDDSIKNGVAEFRGKHIQIGTAPFED